MIYMHYIITFEIRNLYKNLVKSEQKVLIANNYKFMFTIKVLSYLKI